MMSLLEDRGSDVMPGATERGQPLLLLLLLLLLLRRFSRVRLCATP